MKIINHLIWLLPPLFHEWLLAKIGYRLVKLTTLQTGDIRLQDGSTRFIWTKKYPLDLSNEH
jgi:hypothetical protein